MSKIYFESESLYDAMWKNFYKEEDKWESMPEADFLDVHGGCPRHWFQLGFSAGLDAVVKADPVPHEMSAVEYIREYRRMCNFYFGKPATDGGWDGCGDCPGRLNGKKNCILSPTRDESSIPIIEKWAKEHLEERSEE